MANEFTPKHLILAAADDMRVVEELLARDKLSRDQRNRILNTFIKYADEDSFRHGLLSQPLVDYISRELAHIVNDDGYKPFSTKTGKRSVVDWEAIYDSVDDLVSSETNPIWEEWPDEEAAVPTSLTHKLKTVLRIMYPGRDINWKTIENHVGKYKKSRGR